VTLLYGREPSNPDSRFVLIAILGLSFFSGVQIFAFSRHAFVLSAGHSESVCRSAEFCDPQNPEVALSNPYI
jgi:hypothetical protein